MRCFRRAHGYQVSCVTGFNAFHLTAEVSLHFSLCVLHTEDFVEPPRSLICGGCVSLLMIRFIIHSRSYGWVLSPPVAVCCSGYRISVSPPTSNYLLLRGNRIRRNWISTYVWSTIWKSRKPDRGIAPSPVTLIPTTRTFLYPKNRFNSPSKQFSLTHKGFKTDEFSRRKRSEKYPKPQKCHFDIEHKLAVRDLIHVWSGCAMAMAMARGV